MEMTDCRTLLAAYANQGSESAFRELVTRYLGLVYSSALRLVGGDTHLAEDVAQTVFMHLAHNAQRFSGELRLGGWLHRETCNVALNLMRAERRRRVRERRAAEMKALEGQSDDSFAEVAPVLDEAIDRLGEEERTAIILRFFEQYDFRSVGEVLGSSEDAARMRVNRAIEKLHVLLKQRGVTLSAAALGTALATEAVTAAPAGLAAGIAAAALASAATGGGTAVSLLKLMTMTQLKTAVICVLVVAGMGIPLVVQHQSVVKLRERGESLQRQVEQAAQLSAENERLSNLVAQANRTLPDEQQNELLRLRGQVGMLRAQIKELEGLRKENLRLQADLDKTRSSSQQEDPATGRFREVGFSKLQDAKLLVLALMMFADDHTNQQCATNLQQLEPILQSANPTVTRSNQFELVYQGLFTGITNPAQTIVIREKQAWQADNGGWFKTYGFGDGHSEIHLEVSGNFDDWERQRMFSSARKSQ